MHVKPGQSRAKQPQLYIYDIEATLALPRPSVRLSRPDDYSSKWEPLRRFAALTANAANIVHSPSVADAFFIPLQLDMLSRQLGHVSAERLAGDVVRAMRKVGPFWETQRSRHIVLSIPCPNRPDVRESRKQLLSWRKQMDSRDVAPWTALLNGTIRVCVHATQHTDRSRALHVPYFVSDRFYRGQGTTYSPRKLGCYVGSNSNPIRQALISQLPTLGQQDPTRSRYDVHVLGTGRLPLDENTLRAHMENCKTKMSLVAFAVDASAVVASAVASAVDASAAVASAVASAV